MCEPSRQGRRLRPRSISFPGAVSEDDESRLYHWHRRATMAQREEVARGCERKIKIYNVPSAPQLGVPLTVQRRHSSPPDWNPRTELIDDIKRMLDECEKIVGDLVEKTSRDLDD